MTSTTSPRKRNRRGSRSSRSEKRQRRWKRLRQQRQQSWLRRLQREQQTCNRWGWKMRETTQQRQQRQQQQEQQEQQGERLRRPHPKVITVLSSDECRFFELERTAHPPQPIAVEALRFFKPKCTEKLSYLTSVGEEREGNGSEATGPLLPGREGEVRKVTLSFRGTSPSS